MCSSASDINLGKFTIWIWNLNWGKRNLNFFSSCSSYGHVISSVVAPKCCEFAGFLSCGVEEWNLADTKEWSDSLLTERRWEQKASSLAWDGSQVGCSKGFYGWSFIENWPGNLNLFDVTSDSIRLLLLCIRQTSWSGCVPLSLVSLRLSISGIFGGPDCIAPHVALST